MKPNLMILLALTIFVGWQLSTKSDAQSQRSAAALEILPNEQIKALVTERPAPDGTSIRLSARAGQNNRLTPEQRQNHIQAGTIPFQITADVFMVAENGRRGRRVNGDILFYVLDQDGNVVDAGKRTVRQMCPT